jgi:hypothetical protein
MKKWAIALCIILWLPLVAAAERIVVIDESASPSRLFVITAPSGSLQDNQLTLQQPSQVLYFTDRPSRQAGHISLLRFIGRWSKGEDSFADNPPNATLSVLSGGKEANTVLELTDPQVEEGKLIFTVKTLEGEVPASFKRSALFIDID